MVFCHLVDVLHKIEDGNLPMLDTFITVVFEAAYSRFFASRAKGQKRVSSASAVNQYITCAVADMNRHTKHSKSHKAFATCHKPSVLEIKTEHKSRLSASSESGLPVANFHVKSGVKKIGKELRALGEQIKKLAGQIFRIDKFLCIKHIPTDARTLKLLTRYMSCQVSVKQNGKPMIGICQGLAGAVFELESLLKYVEGYYPGVRTMKFWKWLDTHLHNMHDASVNICECFSGGHNSCLWVPGSHHTEPSKCSGRKSSKQKLVPSSTTARKRSSTHNSVHSSIHSSVHSPVPTRSLAHSSAPSSAHSSAPSSAHSSTHSSTHSSAPSSAESSSPSSAQSSAPSSADSSTHSPAHNPAHNLAHSPAPSSSQKLFRSIVAPVVIQHKPAKHLS
jgi:hypothetical protein